MPENVPKGKENSGKTLNRCILEGSNGSKKQKKAEEKTDELAIRFPSIMG